MEFSYRRLQCGLGRPTHRSVPLGDVGMGGLRDRERIGFVAALALPVFDLAVTGLSVLSVYPAVRGALLGLVCLSAGLLPVRRLLRRRGSSRVE
ncbi:hypothetical protein [Streptomyces sp. NPDC094032]|uniref:hypothetical protein n=1 Tax=Streptomyces sp. NPDC094032 TaxID=3155308 RepID=UPI00331F39B2